MGKIKERNPELGQRMRQAARRTKRTNIEIAREGGWQPDTLSRWFSAEQEPGCQDLGRFARITGVSTDWLLHGEEGLYGELMTIVRDMFDYLMMGKSMAEAFDRATGEPEALSEEERLRFHAMSSVLRTGIQEKAGREWDLLPVAEKEAVLADIVARIARQD